MSLLWRKILPVIWGQLRNPNLPLQSCTQMVCLLSRHCHTSSCPGVWRGTWITSSSPRRASTRPWRGSAELLAVRMALTPSSISISISISIIKICKMDNNAHRGFKSAISNQNRRVGQNNLQGRHCRPSDFTLTKFREKKYFVQSSGQQYLPVLTVRYLYCNIGPS